MRLPWGEGTFGVSGGVGPGSRETGTTPSNRKGNCAENLAWLRKLALNLAQLEPSNGSMRGKLKRASSDNQSLASILSQFAQIQMR